MKLEKSPEGHAIFEACGGPMFFLLKVFFFFFLFSTLKNGGVVDLDLFPPFSSDRWKHSGGWYLLWLLCAAHGHGSSPLSCGISGGWKRGHREVVPMLQ